MWLYYHYRVGDTIDLESLGIHVAIEQLYTGVHVERS
jgi:hypothetical protein